MPRKNTDVKEKPAERIPKSNVSGKTPESGTEKAWTEAEEKSRTKLRENISAQGMVADTFHSAVKQNTDFTIIQTGSYHFPLTIRPPTKMEEKIAAKNKRVIQIGLNTHSHDHEINPVTFSTAKIKTKATIGSILDRWDFFSVCITEPPQIPIYQYHF